VTQKEATTVSRVVRRFLGQNSIIIVFIVLVIFGAIVSPYFLKPRNIENLARNLPVVGLMAIGMTFVILTAGIDLSVGSILSLIVVVTAYHLNGGGLLVTALLLPLAIGLGIGALNGVLITKGRLEPFIVTLATLSIVGGAALIWTDGQPVSIGTSEQAALFAKLAPGNTLSIPTPMVIFIVLFLAAVFIAKYTQLGRNIYAVGSNVEAARLTGVNVGRTKIAAYAISGFLAGVASIIWVSRLTAGSPVGGAGYELDAIACVVIGGTSLFGGEGSLIGTLFGILIVSVLNNLMNLLGIPPYSQKIAKGVIIALAVFIERQRELRRASGVVAKFELQEQA
jgi:ribose transport system permease protein